MDKIQEQLNQLYKDYLKKIFSEMDLLELVDSDEISSPLFLDCHAEKGKYLDSDFKILYVGKENNYWVDSHHRERKGISDLNNFDNYIKGLTEIYYEFNIGFNYSTAFFTFLDILMDELRKDIRNVGVMWTNLLRHDSCGNGRVSPEIEQKITYDNNFVFRKELEILKPDAVVFVTGPKYDSILEKTFPGLEKSTIGKWEIGEFCSLVHKDLPKKSVRLYHPDAHKWYGEDYRWKLVADISEIIKK